MNEARKEELREWVDCGDKETVTWITNGEVEELLDAIDALEKENFALAASQRKDGYGYVAGSGDGGSNDERARGPHPM